MKRTLGILLLALAAAPGLRAQSDVATLIAAARAQVEQFNTDSASALLERALAPSAGATTTERVRAYVLYGIAQLTAKNVTSARQAFRSALQLNPAERVDSLEFLEPENLLQEFNAQRAAVTPAAVAAPSALAVDVDVPFDTTLSPPDRRLRITTKPSYRARVVATVAPAEAPLAVVWSDTEVVENSGAAGWNLQGRDGSLVPSGRYILRVTASDSLGHVAPAVERALDIHVALDTTPLPALLPASAFAKERGRSAWWLVVGAAAGVIGGVLAPAEVRTLVSIPGCIMQRPGDCTATSVQNGSLRPMVTAAGALVGIALYVFGPRHTLSNNVRHNRELREQDAQRRAAIAQANARARANASARIRVEGTFR